jgi:FMN phosphatase YigB (HAD superfamily)
MIKALIFDFGSVLYKNDWGKLVPEFKEKFGVDIGLADGKNQALIDLYNKANVSDIDFSEFLKVAGVKDVHEGLREYKKLYNKHKIVNNELLELITKLRENYLIFGYTDIQEVHFDANKESGFYDLFEEVFSSFKFKSLKARDGSFEKLSKELVRYNLRPEECLFIDDWLPNIENARKTGFNAIQYTDFPKILGLKKSIYFILNVSQIIEIAKNLPEWFTKEALVQIKKDCEDFEFITEGESSIDGFLIYEIKDKKCFIKWMAVKRDIQCKGIGRKLIQNLEKICIENKVNLIETDTLAETEDYEPYKKTRAFYHAVGFKDKEIIKKGYLEGSDKLILVKTI